MFDQGLTAGPCSGTVTRRRPGLNVLTCAASPPGITNEAPGVSSHCTPIEVAGDRVVFAPPGESVVTTYDRNGFTAVIEGQFTDHWRRID